MSAFSPLSFSPLFKPVSAGMMLGLSLLTAGCIMADEGYYYNSPGYGYYEPSYGYGYRSAPSHNYWYNDHSRGRDSYYRDDHRRDYRSNDRGRDDRGRDSGRDRGHVSDGGRSSGGDRDNSRYTGLAHEERERERIRGIVESSGGP